VARRKGLRVHVLKWRLGMIGAAFRGMTPLFILNWLVSHRLNYRLAADHPTGACHHQKLIVIDDALAFCGGIDMTADRWDTREHRDHDPHRRRPSGWRYPPFHDVAAMIDGPAAAALGDWCRARWHSATGEVLVAPGARSDPWPAGCAPRFTDIGVAIARTAPAYNGQPELREVERLYLDMIAGARRLLYMEAQYFASRAIGRALIARLTEPDPPEIVLINPVASHGWLEEQAMGTARRLLLSALRTADHAGRFRAYSPVTARGRMIYVHAKLMIADDRVLRLGSSNLNNRSMGLDSECDLAVEAVPGSADESATRLAIADLRDGLLAEHLGVRVQQVRDAWQRHGSLIAAIEQLRTGGARTLVPCDVGEPGVADQFIVENEILDPERPDSLAARMSRRFRWKWLQHAAARRRERGLGLNLGGDDS
jgi:phospholipase D1/2